MVKLFYPAGIENGDLVGQRERFFLITSRLRVMSGRGRMA
jgi:hypothetical protein